jgi:hypothetical protein
MPQLLNNSKLIRGTDDKEEIQLDATITVY